MRMGIGLGIGINRSNYAQGIFNAYSARVVADGGTTEAGGCVDAGATALLQTASLLLIPSGYKAGKLYSEIPTNGNGDLTWTRASTAIRTNSSSLLESMATGVPRLSYMYGSCPAVLLEPQRTNLALQSQDFDNASWAKASVTISANTTTSPSGIADADKMIENVGSSSKYLSSGSFSANTYTASIYVKPSNKTFFWMSLDSSVTAVFFNLTTGTIAATGTGNTGTIASVGNGWFRCTITRTNVISHALLLGTSDSSASYISNGNGVDGVFLWGGQIEAGAYPTTYIPTTSATATRVADTASKTGISSLIGQSEGTIFVDFYVSGIGANAINIYNNDRTPSAISTNAIFFKPNGSIECQTFLGNGTFNTISITASTYTVGQRIKLAYRYKSGDFALYINGIQKGTSTSTMTFVGTKSQIYLDDNAVIYGYQEAVHYNQFGLFTTALTNAELTQLTT